MDKGSLGLLLMFLLLCAAAGLCAARVRAEPVPDIHGAAWVHDGDTMRINENWIRLWGIDAVELNQRCADGGGDKPCGAMARAALADMVAGRVVVCTPQGASYRRVVARCHVGGMDLGRAMVKAGMAFDAPYFSRGQYAGEAAKARAAGRGLWAMAWEAPARWRACHGDDARARARYACGT